MALDIDLIDLRPEETDEPTRLIRVSGNSTGGRAVREREPVRERRRDYDDDYEPSLEKTEQQIDTAQELIDLVEKYIGDYYNKN